MNIGAGDTDAIMWQVGLSADTAFYRRCVLGEGWEVTEQRSPSGEICSILIG